MINFQIFFKDNFFKLFFFILFFIFFLVGIYQEFYPFPVWDSFDTQNFFYQFKNGNVSLKQYLFGQHNEHIIILNRLLILLDYYLFNSSIIFLYLTNITFILINFISIIYLIENLTTYKVKNSTYYWLILLVSMLFFNWYQKENFMQYMQVQFNAFITCFLLSVLLLFKYFQNKKKKYIINSLLLYFLSFYISGQALVLIFFYISVCFLTRSYRLMFIYILLTAFVFFLNISLLEYEFGVYSSKSIDHSNLKLIFSSLSNLKQAFVSLFLLFGSYFTVYDPAKINLFDIYFGFFIFILVLITNLNFILKFRKNKIEKNFLISIINFLVLLSLSIVYARYHNNIYIFNHSRYSTFSILLFIFIIIYLFEYLSFTKNIYKIFSILVFVTLINQQFEATKMRPWKPRSEIAIIDVYFNIYDKESLKYIYPIDESSFQHLKRIVNNNIYLSQHKIKFSNLLNNIIKQENILKLDLGKIKECSGVIEGTGASNEDLFKIDGWVFDLSEKKVPKIAYLTLNKNIVGFVLTGKIKKHYQLISTIDQKITRKSGFLGYLNSQFIDKKNEIKFFCL